MKKYIILLVSVVVVMMWLTSFAQYYMTRREAKNEILSKAGRDMKESQRVAVVKAEVESAVRNIKGMVQSSIDKPNIYYSIASQLVRNNPHVVGGGVAFKPDYYKAEGRQRLFAPYAYDQQPDIKLKKKKVSTPQIRPTLLPFDYTTREWFTTPMSTGNSMWTQPYMDQGGTHIVLMTYVMPFYDKSGDPAGVFYADVPLEDVSIMSQEVHDGMTKHRVVILGMQLAMVLIVILVIWLVVHASKRYKEQYVDPEKQHLIEQLEKLRTVNHRLTARNMELAKKLQIKEQTINSEWFG
jgi:sigma-B regulation protein RsbU (phosphoserine phosphatase)